MSDQQSSRRDLLKVGAVSLGTVGGAALFPSIASAAPGEAALAASSTSASSRYFLELSGIPGDSTDAAYPNQIVVSSWSWGVTNTGTVVRAAGAGSGRSTPGNLVYTAPMSLASPTIMLAAATGRHLDHAVLTVVTSGGMETKRMTVRLVEVLVTSYQQSSGDINGLPVEVVSLNYGKVIDSEYPQRPDGSIAGPVVATFDYRTQATG